MKLELIIKSIVKIKETSIPRSGIHESVILTKKRKTCSSRKQKILHHHFCCAKETKKAWDNLECKTSESVKADINS